MREAARMPEAPRARLNTFVTNAPPGVSTSAARRSASSTSAAWLYASLAQAPPTLGAPSCSTQSTPPPAASFLMAWRAAPRVGHTPNPT